MLRREFGFSPPHTHTLVTSKGTTTSYAKGTIIIATTYDTTITKFRQSRRQNSLRPSTTLVSRLPNIPMFRISLYTPLLGTQPTINRDSPQTHMYSRLRERPHEHCIYGIIHLPCWSLVCNYWFLVHVQPTDMQDPILLNWTSLSF